MWYTETAMIERISEGSPIGVPCESVSKILLVEYDVSFIALALNKFDEFSSLDTTKRSACKNSLDKP